MKMKKLVLFCLVAVLTGIFALPSLAVDLNGNYLTTIVSNAGENTITGKFCFSDGKMRMGMQEYVMISRMDKKVSWTLMPLTNTYTEQPLSFRTAAYMSTGKLKGEIGRVEIGPEAAGGIDCIKYKVTCKTGAKKRESLFLWMSSDYPIPVKTATIDGKWSIEYSQIQTTITNPDSLFEIPAGFSKI
jgi:outer membrane lipoprotein-sorting protein